MEGFLSMQRSAGYGWKFAPPRGPEVETTGGAKKKNDSRGEMNPLRGWQGGPKKVKQCEGGSHQGTAAEEQGGKMR